MPKMARQPWLPLTLLLASGLGVTGLGGCSDYDLVQFDGDDVFQQLEASEVDVLLVVDNSCSMQPYQDELADNFDTFLTYFEEGDVDYRLGVVTSTISDVQANEYCSQAEVDAIPAGGQLVGDADGPTIITPDTDDGAAVFADIVDVGVCGAGFEAGIESAYQALTGPVSENYNDGFLRDDAYLSIIFVSDEQDFSPHKVNDYINGFRDVKGARDREVFNASALVVTDIDECSSAQQAAGEVGTRYIDVAEQTGGVVGSICANDFTDIVNELSLASSRLTDTFYLTKLPDVASLAIYVDDGKCADDEGELDDCQIDCDGGDYPWIFQLHDDAGEVIDEDDCDEDDGCRGAIVFERTSLPPVGSQISARYNFGDGDPDDFCESDEDDE
jgi:hypothetical protein